MRHGLPRRLPLAALVAGAIISLVPLGCRHRGEPWQTRAIDPAGPAGEASFEILVVGQPRAAASTRAVARELDQTLARAHHRSRGVAVIWLGTDLGPPGPDRAGSCPGPGEAFSGPGLAKLDATLAGATEAGASVWGLPGPDGWRCGLAGPAQEGDAEAPRLPYRQPGLAYVVQVEASGAATLASTCEPDGCQVRAPSPETLAELVFLDFSPWHYPELASPELVDALELQQRSLLDALAARDPGEGPEPTRILVSPIPVDSAGPHGFGGRLQRASFRYLPQHVRAAIGAGIFDGVIGGLERSLQLSEDISDAIVLSDRSFVARPVFQLISGSAGGASGSAPSSRGTSMIPELESEHPGFARVLLDGERVKLRLHARVGGRWRVGGVDLPLARPPHGELRQVPPIAPCHDCDPLRGASDGPAFVPRTER